MRRRLLVLFCLLSLLFMDAASASTFNQFDVAITEFKYTPKVTLTIAPDDRVRWTNNGSRTHTATGSHRLGAWDSGDIAPGGGTYNEIFETSGTFAYHCKIHPRKMHGVVKVPTVVFPASGNAMTVYTITWATTSIPTGYNVDVQIKRPGRKHFRSFAKNQMGAIGGTTFTPDAGPGLYRFRSRLQRNSNGATSGYSPIGVITIS